MEKYRIKEFQLAYLMGIDTLVIECIKSHMKGDDKEKMMIGVKALAKIVRKEIFVMKDLLNLNPNIAKVGY